MTRIYIESASDKNKPAGGNGEAVPSVILQSLGKLASVPSGSGSVCLPWGSVRFWAEAKRGDYRSAATILPQQPILGPRCPDELGPEGRALIHCSERPMWMAWLSEGQLLRMCECCGTCYRLRGHGAKTRVLYFLWRRDFGSPGAEPHNSPRAPPLDMNRLQLQPPHKAKRRYVPRVMDILIYNQVLGIRLGGSSRSGGSSQNSSFNRSPYSYKGGPRPPFLADENTLPRTHETIYRFPWHLMVRTKSTFPQMRPGG
jgi:hypothetical protein